MLDRSMGAASARAIVALLPVFAFLVIGLWPRAASAEDLVIKQPGHHAAYSVELEPHLVAAFFLPTAGSGIGVGARASIPIVKNGFVKTINNSVAIGFGLDFVRYSGCFYWRNTFGDCAVLNRVWLPVVMQWNFFLSTHWSVFGEPGLAIGYSDWGTGCTGRFVDNNGTRFYDCGPGPNRVTFEPFAFFVGGRFHFSGGASLTMRIGWPYASVGVSFFP
jgi:hypothetical protein